MSEGLEVYNKVISHIKNELIGTRRITTTIHVNSVVDNTDASKTYVTDICQTLHDMNRGIFKRIAMFGQGVKFRCFKPQEVRWPDYDQYRAAHNSELDTPGNKTSVPNRLYSIQHRGRVIIHVPTNTPAAFANIERMRDAFLEIAEENNRVTVSDVTTTTHLGETTVKEFFSALRRMFPIMRGDTSDAINMPNDVIRGLKNALLKQEPNGERVEKRTNERPLTLKDKVMRLISAEVQIVRGRMAAEEIADSFLILADEHKEELKIRWEESQGS